MDKMERAVIREVSLSLKGRPVLVDIADGETAIFNKVTGAVIRRFGYYEGGIIDNHLSDCLEQVRPVRNLKRRGWITMIDEAKALDTLFDDACVSHIK